MALFLNEEHEKFKQIEEAISLLNLYGIKIIGHHMKISIGGGNEYTIRDIDDGRVMEEFPPSFEFKLRRIED